MRVRLSHCIYLNFKLADSLLKFQILRRHFQIVFGSKQSLNFRQRSLNYREFLAKTLGCHLPTLTLNYEVLAIDNL
jgi:hypothetical protein